MPTIRFHARRKPGTAFSLTLQSVEGDYAYILWTAETADNVYEIGTDTFVVRSGKIAAQSLAGKITPKSTESRRDPGGTTAVDAQVAQGTTAGI